MRRLLHILIGLSLMLVTVGSVMYYSMVVTAQNENVQVIVNASDTIFEDTDFTATVDIMDVTEINAAQYDITIDTGVLRLDDVTDGLIDSTDFDVFGYSEISPGTYRIVNTIGTGSATGSGYMAVLHFHFVGSYGESSNIDITNGLLSGMSGEISASWTGDTVSTTRGLLRVQTDPAVPTRIFLDGIQRENWGLNWVKMLPGDYMLSFSDVYYFNIPTTVTVNYYPGTTGNVQSLSEPITIYENTVTEVIVNFEQLGNLRVETVTPAVAATIFCNGYAMDDWAFWVNIEPGEYTISFEPLGDGLITPPPIQVTVNAGAGTHVMGDYTTGTSYVVP